MIGPEGGFAPHEVEGASLCSFGEQVLRDGAVAVRDGRIAKMIVYYANPDTGGDAPNKPTGYPRAPTS